MIKKEDVYRIGQIGKPHGVKGELSFHFEDDVFDRTDADYLILDVYKRQVLLLVEMMMSQLIKRSQRPNTFGEQMVG